MAGPDLRVEGLKDLRRELKKMSEDGTYKSELRGVNMRAATIVAVEARGNAQRGASTKTGKHATMGSAAIASIRPLAGQGRASVAGGRASLPYFPGWNSGGRAKQFPSMREPDYVMWQAVKDKRPDVVEAYSDGIERLTGKYFR